MGDKLLEMIPGVNSKALKDINIDERKMAQTEAIIKSMTKRERERPDIINFSRRKRIAAGAGVQVSDVNKLIAQYEQTAKLMKQFSNGKGGFKMPKGFAKQAAKMTCPLRLSSTRTCLPRILPILFAIRLCVANKISTNVPSDKSASHHLSYRSSSKLSFLRIKTTNISNAILTIITIN